MNHKNIILSSITLMGTILVFPVLAAEDEAAVTLDEMSVIGTREAQSIKETALSIGVIKKQDIEDVKPGHPSEIMQRVPGVHVNVTGGEGHMTAIRQPITTKAVYLYLEDGIPTRSTGFFNHNALYEINVPQSERIEVLKGPGSALYGSDAIGGVINVDTKPSPLKPEADVSVEAGSFGWARVLLSGGSTTDNNGYRVSLNATHTDGWRDSTQYDRQSATVRWDRSLESGASLKTVLSTSEIDQQTAGSSRLLEDDYLNNPTLNYTPISYRKVSALRLSTAYEKEASDSLLTVTPYVRSNSMELLPNWALSYDPVVYETKNDSLGVLFKYRQDYTPMRTRVVYGVDFDYSPGSRNEQSVTATKAGSIYTSYTTGVTVYDYDVTYQAVSPYTHVEFSPSDSLRISAGLRYDNMSYDYDNKISDADIVVNPFPSSPLRTVTYKHVSDTTVNFAHLSPKIGATYKFNESTSGFLSYRNAFRAPSEGQIFRQGSAINTVDLKPIKVSSIEAGLRGKSKNSNYNLSIYMMSKKDDILTYTDTAANTKETMNAGETSHQGIEVGYGRKFTPLLKLDVAVSYATHKYEEWNPKTGISYTGNEMESAPNLIANARLGHKSSFLNGGKMEVEWVKLGDYWMDAANTYKYAGHHVFNLRINHFISKDLELYGRLMNVADVRYATSAKYTSPTKIEYAPGMPRTAYVGMKYKF